MKNLSLLSADVTRGYLAEKAIKKYSSINYAKQQNSVLTIFYFVKGF